MTVHVNDGLTVAFVAFNCSVDLMRFDPYHSFVVVTQQLTYQISLGWCLFKTLIWRKNQITLELIRLRCVLIIRS